MVLARLEGESARDGDDGSALARQDCVELWEACESDGLIEESQVSQLETSLSLPK